MLTLALALGTRLPAIAAGAITAVLFGVGWFVGVLGSLAVVFDAAPLARAADVMRVIMPTDGLWRGVIYGLEPPLVLLIAAGRDPEAMAANPFFAGSPPPGPFVAWSVVWVVIVLLAGIALFRRREL